MSICSGFASVYLEKILKGDKTSIWVTLTLTPTPTLTPTLTLILTLI